MALDIDATRLYIHNPKTHNSISPWR